MQHRMKEFTMREESVYRMLEYCKVGRIKVRR